MLLKPKPVSFRPTSRALEDRRLDVARTDEVKGAVFRVTGRIQVEGAGEGVVTVAFPVHFMEEPAFSFGGVMYQYAPLTAGNYPTASLLVLRWDREVRSDTGAGVYNGAEFVVVVTGETDQIMEVQWHMEGRALVNPA